MKHALLEMSDISMRNLMASCYDRMTQMRVRADHHVMAHSTAGRVGTAICAYLSFISISCQNETPLDSTGLCLSLPSLFLTQA